jgi:hypothetical protein
MAFAPSKSNTSRLVAALLAVFAVALIAGASQASAADRGWTPTGDLQNVYLQVHNGLIAPDSSDADQFEVSVINYNSFAVNGKLSLYAVGKNGKPKGKPVAEGGFQLPADGPTTAILLPTDKLTALIKAGKFKGLKVRAKVAFWTNGFTKLGKAEGNYTIVKKLKGAKGAANALPAAANLSYKVKEGATLSAPIYALLSGATDADFDHLYLRVTQRPKNAKTFTIAADGLFSYVGAANFAGTDSFVFDIFDGTGYSTPVTVNITVTAKAPTISTIPDQKVNGGTQAAAQTFSLKSLVAGSGTITYALTGAFPTGTTINASNGTVTVPTTAGIVTAGSYTATLGATNSAGTTTKNFKIIVKPGAIGTIDHQDDLEDTPIPTLVTSTAFSAAAGATYSAPAGLPAGLAINPATGDITGTPSDPVSQFDVTITVTDANGTASQAFTWSIQLNT